MRLYIESTGEARSVATALAEYIDTEAIKLRHNRTACGCGTCSASRDANALLAKIVKLDNQKHGLE